MVKRAYGSTKPIPKSKPRSNFAAKQAIPKRRAPQKVKSSKKPDKKETRIIRGYGYTNGHVPKDGFQSHAHMVSERDFMFKPVSGPADAIQRFEAALEMPGEHDAAFIDTNHVCPQSHGIARGAEIRTISNNKYWVVATCAAGSLTASNLANTRSSIGYIEYDLTDQVTETDATGGNASWIPAFGTTTGAKKIMNWASRVDVCLHIPPATLIGGVYMGNVPFTTWTGSKISELISWATSYQHLQGTTYTLRSSLLQTDLIHSGYGATLTDERVSYMIVESGAVGSISGAAPLFYQATLRFYCNYVFVPANVPLMTPTLLSIANREARVELPPNDSSKVATFMSTVATIAGYAGNQIANPNSALWTGWKAASTVMALMKEIDVVPQVSMEADLEWLVEWQKERWTGDMSPEILESLALYQAAQASLLVIVKGEITRWKKRQQQDIERHRRPPIDYSMDSSTYLHESAIKAEPESNEAS